MESSIVGATARGPFSVLLLFATAGTCFDSIGAEQVKEKTGESEYAAYLFAHMTKEDYGRLYYSVSTDGLHWRQLNGGKRVLGEEYRGHPDIGRGHDGRYYMLGNYSKNSEISIWVSSNLVKWTKLRDFFPDISKTPNFEPALRYHGAPKIFYDEPSSQYLITWHSTNEKPVREEPEKFWSGMRTLYVTSKDLETFSDPKRLFSFDTMAELLAQRIADKQDDTSDQIRARKAKRSALICGVVGILLLAVAALNAWSTHRDQHAARLLEEVGIPGEAQLERRFLAPNGITPRLEYRITTAEGRSATRNAEVTRPYWDSLEGATTVPVIYVPSEPENSKLQIGEADDQDPTKKPLVGYGLSALVSVICLVLLAAAVFQWYGWDIDLDSKSGTFSIRRFGTCR